MKAYLDFNVIVALNKGEISVDKLPRIDNTIMDFPFSASHIQELNNISHSDPDKRENYIHKHLQTVADISKNLYFYQTLNNEVQQIMNLHQKH
jgi:hypothetical protein